MATYSLKKSYQLKNLRETTFKDLWGDHGVFTTMWIFGKPVKSGISGINVDLSEASDENNYQIETVQFDYRQAIATLMQDFLAIFVLLFLLSVGSGDNTVGNFLTSLIALPLLVGGSILLVRYVLQPLFARFDRIGEYVFLLAIGWCMGAAEVAELAGLSREIGAFVAGISLATSPIAQYIALNLKPLRDFFLILFLFKISSSSE